MSAPWASFVSELGYLDFGEPATVDQIRSRREAFNYAIATRDSQAISEIKTTESKTGLAL
jgi:hypothetical protein